MCRLCVFPVGGAWIGGVVWLSYRTVELPMIVVDDYGQVDSQVTLL
jgi:hypothetical protein